jgi:FKBP-type peptidyl-prolyl cis-trans isomerase FkpA
MFRSFFLASIITLFAHEILGFGIEKSFTRRDALASLVVVPFVGTFSPSFVTAIDLQEYSDDPRGLKYKVIEPGTGGKPIRGQKIKTQYTLYLNGFPEDGGKKIDSTKDIFGGQRPFEFMVGVSMVVKGWDLGLMDMSEGETRRLIIPSDLGYGEEGVGGALTGGVPGDATLYFEVKLTELGQLPPMTADQVKWLEEHPL